MMTREEFNEILDKILPPTVGGMVRPAEPIPTDLDFCTEFRQLLQADMNLANHENAFLRQLFSNDKITDEGIKAIQNQLANCDLRLVTQALKGLMSPVDKTKLDGIQAGATNYAHPANHPASIITQDASHRMVSDTQISTWNGKANANHGNHVPKLETANNARYLRNDGTWQDIAPGEIGAAAVSHVHDKTQLIDLTASAYNQNTWYPVYGEPYPAISKLSHITCIASLGYSKPTWSTHASGYYARVEMLGEGCYWGGAIGHEICLAYSCRFTVNNVMPIGYAQMPNSGRPVFYLRGGGKYTLISNYYNTWSIVTTSYTINENTIKPTTAAPKVNINGGEILSNIRGNISGNFSGTATLTGTPVAPTAAAATNNTQIATTAFVKAVAAPTSHAHDDRYYTESEMNAKLNTKANLNSPGLTGTPTAPTAAAATNNTQIATTAFVKAVATAANIGGVVGGSLMPNGWVKFANGLIIQWGSMNSSADGIARLTFPVTFTSFYTIIGIHVGGGIAIVSELALYHYLNSACLWVKQADGTVNTFGLNWIAVGR